MMPSPMPARRVAVRRTRFATYFVAHPTEWADLQSIAQPLRTLRQQCEVDVAPADIARLYDAMAS